MQSPQRRGYKVQSSKAFECSQSLEDVRVSTQRFFLLLSCDAHFPALNESIRTRQAVEESSHGLDHFEVLRSTVCEEQLINSYWCIMITRNQWQLFHCVRYSAGVGRFLSCLLFRFLFWILLLFFGWMSRPWKRHFPLLGLVDFWSSIVHAGRSWHICCLFLVCWFLVCWFLVCWFLFCLH